MVTLGPSIFLREKDHQLFRPCSINEVKLSLMEGKEKRMQLFHLLFISIWDEGFRQNSTEGFSLHSLFPLHSLSISPSFLLFLEQVIQTVRCSLAKFPLRTVFLPSPLSAYPLQKSQTCQIEKLLNSFVAKCSFLFNTVGDLFFKIHKMYLSIFFKRFKILLKIIKSKSHIIQLS